MDTLGKTSGISVPRTLGTPYAVIMRRAKVLFSAIRTQTDTGWFMSGVAGKILPTPRTKLAAAPVEGTTGVFVAIRRGEGRHPGRGQRVADVVRNTYRRERSGPVKSPNMQHLARLELGGL